ncbi:hypothetical protein PG990_001110 [Apiospora arundinis]
MCMPVTSSNSNATAPPCKQPGNPTMPRFSAMRETDSSIRNCGGGPGGGWTVTHAAMVSGVLSVCRTNWFDCVFPGAAPNGSRGP